MAKLLDFTDESYKVGAIGLIGLAAVITTLIIATLIYNLKDAGVPDTYVTIENAIIVPVEELPVE